MGKSLADLRRMAPEQDRGEPALSPPPQPARQPGPRSRYIPAEFRATTLDELRDRCGEAGKAAVQEARCYAALAWLMGAADCEGLSDLLRYAEYARARLKLPCIKAQPRPALALATDEERERVQAVAERLLSEWEAAGSPGLHRAIQVTHQAVYSARVAADERRLALAAVEAALFQGGAPEWA